MNPPKWKRVFIQKAIQKGSIFGWSFHKTKMKNEKNIVNCSDLTVIDYLGEKVFERVGKEWFKYKYDEPSYFDQESFKKCFQMDKLQEKTTHQHSHQHYHRRCKSSSIDC